MATVNSTPPRNKKRACEALPAYGLGDGVLSFRRSLKARERGILDRALEIVGRAIRDRNDATSSPGAVRQYLQLRLAGERRDLFGALYLDTQNRPIAFEVHFAGTLSQTSVYPREIAAAALRHEAAAVILTHNHPSGSVTPSKADIALTATMSTALATLDVRVLDHIIVSGSATLSMAERGLV